MKRFFIPKWIPGISGSCGWTVSMWGYITGIFTKRNNTAYASAYANGVAAHCGAYANNIAAICERKIAGLKANNAELTANYACIEEKIKHVVDPIAMIDTEGTLKRRILLNEKRIQKSRKVQDKAKVRIAKNESAITSIKNLLVHYQNRAVSKSAAKIHRFIRGHAKAGVAVENMDENTVRELVECSFSKGGDTYVED